jgi:multidrug efflux pump subunit AcrB
MPDAPSDLSGVRAGIARIVSAFVDSKLSILFILAAFALGAAAIMVTPREEEPQIIVPMADIFVDAPGASAEEVEMLVVTPLERILWQIDGVEYVYSTARRGSAMATVRFYVGEDREESLVELHNTITMHQDLVPPIVSGWLVKPVEIDDVPIVGLTLYSARYSDHELRRVGEEVLERLGRVKNVSRTAIYGGRPREVRVEFDPRLMAGYNVTPIMAADALSGADRSVTAGNIVRGDVSIPVRADSFLRSAEEVAEVVVGVHRGRPVYLRDVAEVADVPAEPETYTRMGFSNSFDDRHGLPGEQQIFPAVTLGLAKKQGANAVDVADEIIERMDELKRTMLPHGVEARVTRNYGETAQDKVNSLLTSLGFAILTVVLLLAMALGWREASVVALAVPVSFALALFASYMAGYTINRVTLFALILSLGLVVDDPITNVDNIQRHILMRKHGPRQATLFAVAEVLPPVIMSTLAIIVSFTPMFFITGMMGPYMAPMAANVPLTVTFSTLAALTVVPWMTHLMLKNMAMPMDRKKAKRSGDAVPTGIERFYKRAVSPFLESRTLRVGLWIVLLLLLAGSAALPIFRLVPLKMLPFDNKNEFQIVIDMPEGTTLERTDRVVSDFEAFLRRVPEVTDWVSYTGLASPMDFNAMVRHYYLRRGGNVADIRVNLLDKDQRSMQSHAIVLRLRDRLEVIAEKHGAEIQVVESPPGPPVISTLTAEIYGRPDLPYSELIRSGRELARRLDKERAVTDIDGSWEEERTILAFELDKEKAALHGVTSEQVTRTLETAVSGATPALVHEPGERRPLNVRLIMPLELRVSEEELGQIAVQGEEGVTVPLAELGDFREITQDQPIYHKNLERVAYVYAEMAGRSPVEAVLDMQARLKEAPLPAGTRAKWDGEGEWKITLRVFRDLGIAFGAALVGIYMLLVVQTGTFGMPVLIMTAIPLTVIGIMPGFFLLNLLFASPVAGYENPIFFTATSMIGMIALGGIVIRNSVVLIDFIQHSMSYMNLGLREAILRSGAVRMRPIVLTALTTALGAWPITLDPIFSGLAWALIFGLFASTAFTLLVVPVAYYQFFRTKEENAK